MKNLEFKIDNDFVPTPPTFTSKQKKIMVFYEEEWWPFYCEFEPATIFLEYNWGYEKREQMKKWCADNLQARYKIRGNFAFFESENEAVLFKIRWKSNDEQ